MRNFVAILLAVLGFTSLGQANRLDQICKSHRPSPFARIDFQRQADALLKPSMDLPDIRGRRTTQKLLERKAAGQGEQMTPKEFADYQPSRGVFNAPDSRTLPSAAQFDPTSDSFSPLVILRQKMQMDFHKIRNPLLRAEYLLELKNQVRQREINPDIIDELRDDLIEEENLVQSPLEKEKFSEFQRNSEARMKRAELHLTMKESCMGAFESLDAIRRSPEAKLKIQALANCATTCTSEAVGRVLAGAGIALGGWLGVAGTTGTVAAAPVIANPTLAIVGGGIWITSHALYEKSNFRGCVSGCENNRVHEVPKEPAKPAADTTQTKIPSEAPNPPADKTEAQSETSKPKNETKSETPVTRPADEVPKPLTPEKSNPSRNFDSQVSFEEALDQAEARTLKTCLPSKKENQRFENDVKPNSQLQKLKDWMNPFSLGDAVRQMRSWRTSDEAQAIGQQPIQEIFERTARTTRQWPGLSCASKRDFLLNGGQLNNDMLSNADLNCLCPEHGDESNEH